MSTLSREEAVEIAGKHLGGTFWDHSNTHSNGAIIAAIQDAYAAGMAASEADRRDAEVWYYELQRARAQRDRCIEILTAIHSRLAPSQVTMPDGRVFEWSNAEMEHQMLVSLSKFIREIPDAIAASKGE